jgi:hypothetical protein
MDSIIANLSSSPSPVLVNKGYVLPKREQAEAVSIACTLKVITCAQYRRSNLVQIFGTTNAFDRLSPREIEPEKPVGFDQSIDVEFLERRRVN